VTVVSAYTRIWNLEKHGDSVFGPLVSILLIRIGGQQQSHVVASHCVVAWKLVALLACGRRKVCLTMKGRLETEETFSKKSTMVSP
jgi:hypothetical protein